MKTELVSQEKNIVVVKTVFEAAEVDKAIEKTYKNLSQKANIKGFRKGHVPKKTIELYFGKKGIYAETMENVLPEAIDKVIEEYELKLISEPDIKPAEMEEGTPFEVTLTFEVSPEVTFPEITAIEAEKTVYTVSDEMVEENIVRLLEAHSELAPTYEERELSKEVYVSVKYTSNVVEEDGSSSEVEKDQKTEINLAQENMRQEVIDAIVGKKPGDTAVVEFPVEKDSENKDFAGKAMRYDIEILGIMAKKTPELTDETVLTITQSKHKTVDEFRTEVRNQLMASAERQSEETLKDSAVSKITGASEVEVPQTLVDRQKQAIRAEQEDRIKRESGLSFEDFFAQSGMDKEKYETELTEASQRVVKRALVLEAIAEANDIEWTPEELEAEIKHIAIASRIDPKKFHDYVYSNRDRLFEIAEKIRNRKTVDFIVTKVKVTEVEEKKEEAPAEA